MNEDIHDALMYAREQLAVLAEEEESEDYRRGVEDSRSVLYEIIRDNI